MRPDDPDLPAFYFDPMLNPITFRNFNSKKRPSHESTIFDADGKDIDDFNLLGDFKPFLADFPLENVRTAEAI